MDSIPSVHILIKHLQSDKESKWLGYGELNLYCHDDQGNIPIIIIILMMVEH